MGIILSKMNTNIEDLDDSYIDAKASRINPNGLNILQGSFVILSCAVGTGVLGLPYSFYMLSIPVSIFLSCMFVLAKTGICICMLDTA